MWVTLYVFVAGSSPSPSYPGSYLSSHPLNSTCKQSKISSPCFLYKGMYIRRGAGPLSPPPFFNRKQIMAKAVFFSRNLAKFNLFNFSENLISKFHKYCEKFYIGTWAVSLKT